MTNETPKRPRGRPRKNPVPETHPTEAVPVEPVVALSEAQIKALDGDHDGKPGGSLPKASLDARELEGLVAEFFYAYEMQEEIKRGDRFNRIWSFRHQPVKNHDHMRVSVKRGPVEPERLMITSHLPRDMVEAVILELDAETAR